MTREKYILAVDHGTSGIKTALISVFGRVVDFTFEKTALHFLPGGGVEQDPGEWWQAVLNTSARLTGSGKVDKTDIVAVSVSSTFSSTVAVDREGRPLANAITWMDTRGGPYVKKAMAGFPSFDGYGVIRALRWVNRTGGAPTLSGKDDIGHVLLIRNEFPEIYERTYMFLPSKDFLNLKLTGEFAATFDSIHLFWVTDIRDINNVRYDDRLIRDFGIDRDKLPPLVAATDILGAVTDENADRMGLPRGTPVVAGSPDHQSALIGSGAVADFAGHLYIGTSSWVQCVVPFKKTDVLHSVASFPTAIPGKYQSVNEQDIAGEALDFFVEQFYAGHAGGKTGPDVYRHINELAAGAPAGSGKLIFTPWLNGERTPVDNETIRGGLFNLSQTATAGHIIRAVMEGVAYNNRWSLTYVERFIGRKLDPLNIIGGGAKSDLWCRIFADVLNRDIRKVKEPMMANARGAAFIAAVALGHIRFDDIPGLVVFDETYHPRPENREIYDTLYGQFLRLYRVHKKICRTLNKVSP
ncbi:MAG: FGGY-family carbohydrate kinase [Thermodesulfobacteriota bacterium]